MQLKGLSTAKKGEDVVRPLSWLSQTLIVCLCDLCTVQDTSSLVTGAFSRAHWWQGSAKKYPLNWALLRAGGRGRGVRSVKSRDRDCTILRYPALQNPTGLFDFAQDSLKWMTFLVLSQYIAGRPIQPLAVSISLQSFLKLLLSTCSKLEKLFTLCIAAIDPIIETVSTGFPWDLEAVLQICNESTSHK